MTDVTPLFKGPKYKTAVWISRSVGRELRRRAKRDRPMMERFLAKLEHYAKFGLGKFEQSDGPVRYEWDSVYRIGDRSSLFRLIGFFDGPERADFLVIDCFEKRGQKLDRTDKRRIDAVARIKRECCWRKCDAED